MGEILILLFSVIMLAISGYIILNHEYKDDINSHFNRALWLIVFALSVNTVTYLTYGW